MLTGKQKRFLRGLGHHLQAIVQVGKDGITEGLAGALAAALEQHELIKVRLGEAVEGDRDDVAQALADASASEVAQVLGRTVLLYKRREEEPKIVLP